MGRLHVVGDRRAQPGGSLRLDRLLADHWDPAEASLAYVGQDLRVLVDDPTCTPRRLLVLLHHLPFDSPLAAAVGPEWWWQGDVHSQLLMSVLDAMNTLIASTAMTPLALGAKKDAVTKALGSVEPIRRPYTPPKPKVTFEQKVAALMSQFGR